MTELVFGGLGLIPGRASATIPDNGVSWDYTTWLNIAFLLLAAALVVRFTRTGGGMMLRMMGGAPDQPDAENGHASHDLRGGHGAHQVPAAPGDEGHAGQDRTS